MKKDKIKDIVIILLLILVFIGMFGSFMGKLLEARGLKENYCISEESFYYRIEQGILFSRIVETTKGSADGIDYRCIEWNERVSLAKIFLGQKLIYKKGSLLTQSEENMEEI